MRRWIALLASIALVFEEANARLTSALLGHCAVLTNDGRIIVFGWSSGPQILAR